jgi:putative tricarboxylic transport membrane protein
MDVFLEQIAVAFQWSNLLFLLLGSLIGILIGAIPGLTVIMAIALAVPITAYLPLAPSLGLLFGIYCSGMYGGSISAILINTPGTPASVCTTFDGYPLAKQGKAGKALKMSLFSSFIGGLISVILLVVIAQYLSKIALLFGPAEMTALLLFALTIIGVLSGKNLLKGVLAASLGLLLSVVGSDPTFAIPRFTFGLLDLDEGFSFIPTLIGFFAISEFLSEAEDKSSDLKKKEYLDISTEKDNSRLTRKDITSSLKIIFWSGTLGSFVGILPGIGATVAGFLGYGEAQRMSKNPEKFGKGALEGVAAVGSSTNAVTGSALIPLLSLNIPGDTVTAILYGALLMQGIQTGPLIFKTHIDAVYLIYIILILANIFMLITALSLMPLFRKIAEIPKKVIFPVVFIFCVIGSYSIRNNIFDLYVMLGAGVLGYILRRYGIPLAPLIIGYILGLPFEASLQQTLASSDGNLMIFIQRPIALGFLILTCISIFITIRRNKIKSDK